MSGGGVGGALGSALGAALAPETGGMSMALPAILGAAGGAAGGALTGSKNPLMDALMGGVGGGLTGASGLGGDLGISDSAGLFGSDAASAASPLASDITSADLPAASATGSEASNALTGSAPLSAIGGAGSDINSQIASGLGGAPNLNAGLFSSGPDSLDVGSIAPSAPSAPSAASAASAAASSPSLLSQLGTYAANNPLKAAVAGGVGLSALQSILPHPQVNVSQNAANVMATNPGFSASIPKYSLQNTGTPYQGNWYNYGYSPQQSMYNASLQPTGMKHGGAVRKYADGGTVSNDYISPDGQRESDRRFIAAMNGIQQQLGRNISDDERSNLAADVQNPKNWSDQELIDFGTNRYARGGSVRRYAPDGAVSPLAGAQPQPPMPSAQPPMMPPAMKPQMPAGAAPVNPLMLKVAHNVGVAIGKHLRTNGATPPGPVKGAGGGQDDLIPAKLSDGEFVVPADVVAGLGDGSTNAGSQKLHGMLNKVRAHKTSHGSGFPPKAKKNPLSYIPKGA